MRPRSQYSAWVRRAYGKDFLLNRKYFTKAPREVEASIHCSTAVTFPAMDHPHVDDAPGPPIHGGLLDDACLHGPEPLRRLPSHERPQRTPPAPPDIVRPQRSMATKNTAYNYTPRYNRAQKAFLMEVWAPLETLAVLENDDEEPRGEKFAAVLRDGT